MITISDFELFDPNDTRVFEVGTIVKMNPFCIEEAERKYSSNAFSGERKVERLNTSGGDVVVQGSNWWLKKHLIIKGVDYEA